MTTPIEVTRSKLPDDMAHMMPAQSTDPKEYRQVQRRKKDNVPCNLIGNAAWYEDSRQPEPGYIIWRADKKRPTGHRPHRIYRNRRCLVRTPLCKRDPLRDHRVENRRREIRPKKERRKNPQPLPLEERTRTSVRGRDAGTSTDNPPRKPSPYP